MKKPNGKNTVKKVDTVQPALFSILFADVVKSVATGELLSEAA